MKKTLNKLVFLFLLLVFYGCKNYDTGIYRIDRNWNFKAYFLDNQSSITDSCTLQLSIGKGGTLSFIMDQRELIYSYGTCCGKSLKETTGVDERANYIFIHPPRLECFSFTEIPPMPEITLPIDLNTTNTAELQIVRGFDSLNGKTIQQTHKPVQWEMFAFSDTTIKCIRIEGANTNYIDELGVYKCEYLFNEYFGFVQLVYYKPNGESLRIILQSTNFN